MHINLLKKIGGTLLLLMLLFSPTALAQNAPDYGATPPGSVPQSTEGTGGYSPSGTGTELVCRGDRDWSTFISSVLSYDSFTEYWKDIFVRYNTNICQYQDIDSLLKRISGVREQIRKAFYVCADTRVLKDTYYRLQVELYFLRKYIKTDYSDFRVTKPEDVRNDLRKYFTLNKDYFSDAEIDSLYQQFQEKYKGKLETYRNCKDPTWEDLVNKWDEFKESVAGMGPVIKEAGESISKKWDRMANTPMNGSQSLIGGFLDARINGLEPLEGLQQIANELQKNKPEGFTFEELRTAQVQAEQRYNERFVEQEYLKQYQTLYSETSDTYIGAIMERLYTLGNTIQQSFIYQNQTIQCVKGINYKQCGG